MPYESNAPDCLGPALDAGAAIAIAPNAFRPADQQSEARSRTWTYVDEAEATAAFATATGTDVADCIAEGAEAGLQSDEYEPGGTRRAARARRWRRSRVRTSRAAGSTW